MFEWIVRKIDEVRIAIGYVGYEAECRKEWKLNAPRLFPTDAVEREISKRMAEPRQQVLRMYLEPITLLHAKRTEISNTLNEMRTVLNIFERVYSDDLDKQNATLNFLNEERKKCSENLTTTHEELEAAKANVARWHSNSKGVFSKYSQSVADLDMYKSRRNKAAKDIGYHKNERAIIDLKIDKCRADIASIKKDRQAMFDLRKSGMNKNRAKTTIENGNRELLQVEKKLMELHFEMQNFIDHAKIKNGVKLLEAEVTEIQLRRETYIKEFNGVDAKAAREAKYSKQWRNDHGRF